MPVLEWLPSYRWAWLRPDVSAGVTLAAYAIPASLAYASLAGLPPQAGLYCYMLAGLAYAPFGTSRQAAVGPTSAMSILAGATLGGLALGDPSRYIALAALTALLVAAISLVAWTLRLGQIVHFISETVLTGFKAGVALQIAATQLPKLFGINAGGDGFFGRMSYLAAHLSETHALSLAIGAAGLVLLVRENGCSPSGRPCSSSSSSRSWQCRSRDLAARGIAVLGPVPEGLPALGLGPVTLADMSALLPLALACFLLSYIESVSVVAHVRVEARLPGRRRSGAAGARRRQPGGRARAGLSRRRRHVAVGRQRQGRGADAAGDRGHGDRRRPASWCSSPASSATCRPRFSPPSCSSRSRP